MTDGIENLFDPVSNPGALTLMNRLACLAIGLVTFGPLAGVAVAAQPAPAGSPAPAAPAVPPVPAAIPAAAKTSPTPQQFRPQIEAFIAGHLARMTAGDAAVTKSSREALAAEVTSGSPSATYQDLYAESLAKALDPLTGNPSAQIRLQVGVLAARVAATSGNDRMTPVAIKLLSDANAGVVLWGMKVAKGVVAQQVQTPATLTSSKLLPAITAAIAKNPAEGNLAREAYEALQITDLAKLGSFRAGQIPALAPHVLAVLTARTNEYVKGIPDQADADRDAGTFFALYAFPGLPQNQKVQVVQQLVNQMVLSAHHANAMSSGGPVQKAVLDQAASAGKSIGLIADSIDKAGSNPQTKALVAAADFFVRLGAIPPPPDAYVSNANKVVAAIKAIPAYSSITTPQAAPAQPADAGDK